LWSQNKLPCLIEINISKRPSFVLESEFMCLRRERKGFYADDKKSWQDDTTSEYIFSERRPTYIYTEINTISHPYFLILGLLQENVYLWQENKGDRNNSCLLIRILSESASSGTAEY
jgi:hypothetical protein